MGPDDSVDNGVPDTVFDFDPVDDSRSDEELILDVYKVVAELDGCNRELVQRCRTTRHIFVPGLPLRYAFWIECSRVVGVPIDQGPQDRQIWISQVPCKPRDFSSISVKSAGGKRNGIGRL